MRLLAIVADIDPENLGGAEWHFIEVLKHLLPKLESATLVVGGSDKVKSLFRSGKVNLIKTHYPHITNIYSLGFILFSLPKVILLCFHHRFDLIWAKQEFPQGVVGVIVSKLFNIPLYVTCQSARLVDDELVFKGRVPISLQKFFRYIGNMLVSYAFSNAGIVGAVSNFSSKQAKLMGAKNVVIVPNGVDTSIYYPAKTKIRNKNFEIVTTSSLIYRNAVDVLIRSCSKLPRKILWHLNIAGDGPLKQELINLVRELDLETKVTFLGRVKNKDIPNLLRKSDLFVRVSRAEGFGTSFIEAMACGVPIIATPVGGIIDFASNKKNCILVLPDKSDNLCRAIIDLYSNSELKKTVITQALKDVKRMYNWEVISDSVYRILNSLVSKQ